MNPIPCEIIRDLLPLYVDGVCSEQSARLVEEHLAVCEKCREQYDMLRGELPEITSGEKEGAGLEADAVQQDIAFIKNIRRRINKKQILIGCTVIIVICLITTLESLLTPPRRWDIPFLDNRLETDDIQVTELYLLEDDKIYFTLETDKKFTSTITGSFLWPQDTQTLSYQCHGETTLTYSYWEDHFTDTVSSQKVRYVFPLASEPDDDSIGSVRMENSAIYYVGKNGERITIWEKGQNISDAPYDILVWAAEEEYDINRSIDNGKVYMFFE